MEFSFLFKVLFSINVEEIGLGRINFFGISRVGEFSNISIY